MKSIKMLPAYYNAINDDYVVTTDDKLFIPTINTPIASHEIPARNWLQEEFSWLKDASTLVRKEHLEKDDWVSFSAYHDNLNEQSGLLYELDESIVMPDEVVASVWQLKTVGGQKI